LQTLLKDKTALEKEPFFLIVVLIFICPHFFIILWLDQACLPDRQGIYRLKGQAESG